MAFGPYKAAGGALAFPFRGYAIIYPAILRSVK